MAGVCGAWLVLGASGASAGPAEDAAPPEGTAEGSAEAEAKAPPPAPTPPVSVSKVQRDMENGMARLGELASDAKRDSDLVRAACVLDKQERAQGVMELATGELLVVRDSGASSEARGFAAEKLGAAAERLDDLVEQAKQCVGDKSPEESDDETRNEVEEDPLIPIADPTMPGRQPPVPPPVDDGMPPSVGSPSM
ncbi:MAG: hypothetical protein KDK70_08505 [Myxococcales bacterium]|nr:hypothetical protein [Myxococcales bacterium]